MTYQPSKRYRTGVLSMGRPCMSVICDVCSKPRNRGNHQKCAKARQAAGFITEEQKQ